MTASTLTAALGLIRAADVLRVAELAHKATRADIAQVCRARQTYDRARVCAACGGPSDTSECTRCVIEHDQTISRLTDI